ncbi:MAG: prolyl oligopeptidase family serine peptidase [Bdellovibrionales bacterium]|nr:prolyl oligopeptidase family serine peptidase [Bdellovibrionales bacterium]
MHILWILIGGSLGALGRYLIYILQTKWFGSITWPSTLIVNLLGCFGLGLCFSMWRSESLHDSHRMFWMIGFFGSFTTFSTFGMDLFQMIEQKHFTTLSLYLFLSVVMGVILFWAGMYVHPYICKKGSPSMTTTDTRFGITRNDEFAWVRDKNNPEVLALLEQENKKTDTYTNQFASLREELYQQMISRINEDDESYPYPDGEYLYYSKISKGENYKRYYRSHNGQEELLLDLNELAKGKDFLNIGAFEISPSHQKLAYTMDFNGSEIYTIYIKDLQTGKTHKTTVEDCTSNIEWGANDSSLYYSKLDETHRPYQIYHHILGTPSSTDKLIFQDDNLSNNVLFYKTLSDRFMMINSSNKLSSEAHYIDLSISPTDVVLFSPRKENVLLYLDHHDESFVIHTNENAIDFKVLTTPITSTEQKSWVEIIGHQKGRYIEDVSVFKHFWVLWQREQGNQRLRIYDPQTKQTTDIPFEQKAFSLSAESNVQFNTNVYRFGFSSMKTPYSVMEYDVTTKTTQTLKVKKVPGDFNPDDYIVDKIFAPSSDGKTQIPISILTPKNLAKDGQNKVLLYGYGSYGISIDPGFNVPALSLVDRGFIYAIAHIRGSSTNGRSWYEDGKFLHKKNTFNDFIDCAHFLIDQKYTKPKNIAIMGGSAGGLLMGAVVNQEPELWGAVLALVPFVDVINTMLDESLPLTVIEYDEWGNPNEEKFFTYMHSYAPYENIKEANFPSILATGGINDPRVGFWEPTKWVLRLRKHQKASNPILLQMELGAGHQGPSGRYEYYKERSNQYAFVIHELTK